MPHIELRWPDKTMPAESLPEEWIAVHAEERKSSDDDKEFLSLQHTRQILPGMDGEIPSESVVTFAAPGWHWPAELPWSISSLPARNPTPSEFPDPEPWQLHRETSGAEVPSFRDTEPGGPSDKRRMFAAPSPAPSGQFLPIPENERKSQSERADRMFAEVEPTMIPAKLLKPGRSLS